MTFLEKTKLAARPLIYAALFLITAILRIRNFYQVPAYAQLNDTAGYLMNAAEPLFSLNFWAGIRPFTIPLFYKIFNDLNTATVVQLAISLVCWGLLALCYARITRTAWLKPVSFGIVLLFSMSTDIILWERYILSDSLSISLFALLTACMIWLLAEWHLIRAVLLCVVVFFFAFTRESNAWLVMMIALTLIGAWVIFKRNRRYLALGLIFLTIFYLSNLTTSIGKRWAAPFFNTFAERILTDYNKLKFFEKNGMPITPEVLSLARQHGVNNNDVFFYAPELQEFRDWYYANAKSAYMRFLLNDFGRRIEEAVEGSPYMVASYTQIYWPEDFSPILDGWLAQVIYQKDYPWLLIIYTTLLVGVTIPIMLYEKQSNWIVPVFLILLSYPHAFIIYHGDTNELSRHAVIMGIQYRLGGWLVILTALDYAIQRFAAPLQRTISSPKNAAWVLIVLGLGLLLLPIIIDLVWEHKLAVGRTQLIGMILGIPLILCGMLIFHRQKQTKKKPSANKKSEM